MVKTLPMSRFIQSYNQHLSEAEQSGDTIVLQQRGGRATWVLETEDRVHDAQLATECVSAVLTALMHDPAQAQEFSDALAQTLPWVRFLPEKDRQVFVAEMTETLRACASVGRYTAFARLLEDWRDIADAWSDPDLAESLSVPIDHSLDRPKDAA